MTRDLLGRHAVRYDELLTTAQVAEIFKVSQLTVRRWCATGILPAMKLGHEWRISRSRLDRLIEEQLDSQSEHNHSSRCGDSKDAEVGQS